MPTLLVSLGTSPAIVPEAFLLPGVDFEAVHVLTTASIKDADVEFVQGWFASRAVGTDLSVTRVAEFADFRSENDHYQFEEVLYRWWLACCPGVQPKDGGLSIQQESGLSILPEDGGPSILRGDGAGTVPVAAGSVDAGSPAHHGEAGGSNPPYVCLAGGFKTMSSAMQKAAAVLGAAEVFHVLADSVYPGEGGKLRPAASAEEIEESRAKGHFHWIKLGAESGWPQFRADSSAHYPLRVEKEQGVVRWVSAPDRRFRERLREVVERSHNVAGAWDQIGSLPFSILATWPAADLAWLNEPVQPDADCAWIESLPKLELHCHLGGFATHGDALQQVRDAAEQPELLPPLTNCDPPEGWPCVTLQQEPKARLDAYMKLGDNNGSALLKDPGRLRRQCELLYEHLLKENVVYAEIRCSPANYADPARGRSPWIVLQEIKETFDRCTEVAACCQHDGTVAPGVPLGGQADSAFPTSPEADRTGRLFVGFDKDADYHQTWRDLPHRQQAGAAAFVTFRLADSLPKARLEAWGREHDAFHAEHPKPWPESTWNEYRRRFPQRLETWLDEAHGSCVLADAEIGGLVETALRHFDGRRYILDAFVIMPNHVHAIVKPLPGWELESIMHSWKSFTAKEINRKLARSGQLWQHESFDHLLRSSAQLAKLREYVQSNPEKAGLRNGFAVGIGIGLVTEISGRAGEAAASETLAGTVEPSWKAAPTHVNLIIIATRKEKGDYRAAISRHLALAVSAAEHWTDENECRVVGVDLAGFEDKETRAHYFREEFTGVHRCGLALTVHAGENDDAEGIWRAVFDLNARRVGHALHLIDSPELMRSVGDRGIGVEMCPYANHQIKGYDLPPASLDGCRVYPLKRYLDAGIRVSVNTDNVGISAASLAENLLLVARLCPALTRMDILRLSANGLESSFLSPRQRSVMRARIEQGLAPP